MVTYPVDVPRKSYRGSKQNLKRKTYEHNRLARELEEYINRKVEASDKEVQVFLYGFIAADLGIPEDAVRKVLFAVECGHNGLTVQKRASDADYRRA